MSWEKGESRKLSYGSPTTGNVTQPQLPAAWRGVARHPGPAGIVYTATSGIRRRSPAGTDMVIYIVTVRAKTGHEAEVGRFYQDLEPQLRAARGYQGRQILRARAGTMAAAVRQSLSAEELARMPEKPPAGTQFILIERWDSIEDRMAFSRTVAASRGKDLFPHLLPEHSHEFYEDITPA